MNAKPQPPTSGPAAGRRPGRISVSGRGDELLSARNDPRAPARLLRSGAGPNGQPLEGALLLPLDQVLPDPGQPRQDWSYDDGERRLDELAASIRENGILQPLVVRPDGALPDGRSRYLIINGGRRRAAAERAGLEQIPVVVRGAEGTRLRILQLIENLQRQALSPLDEARAYQEIIDAEGITAPALAERLSLSAQHIRDRLRLLADQVVSDAVARRQITIKASRYLLQLPDEELHRFKERIARGEEVTYADVQAVRTRLEANGFVNPRRKGGGHPRRPVAPELAPAPLPAPAEQAGLVPVAHDGSAEEYPVGGHQEGGVQAALPVEQAGLVPVEPAAEDPLAPPTEASRGPIHHPAATAVLLQHFASAFGEAIDPARRRRLADLLLQLEDGDDPASWWSDLYPLIRAQLIRGAD